MNRFLPATHRSDGTITLSLYDDRTYGRYAVLYAIGHDDTKASTIVSCSSPTTLNFATDAGSPHALGRTYVHNFQTHEQFASRVCHNGELTPQSLRQFAHPAN